MTGLKCIAHRWIGSSALLLIAGCVAGFGQVAAAPAPESSAPPSGDRRPVETPAQTDLSDRNAAGRLEGAAAPAKSPWRRWAVLCTPEVRETRLGDLLAVELTNQGELELVERDHLAKIEEEYRLGQLFGADEAAQRLAVGKMLRAEALVLVRRHGAHPEAPLRIVIAECLHGARLHEQDISAEKVDQAARLAAEVVQATRRRFPDGVRRLIAVSNFVCRNLTRDYDAFQEQFADLLRRTLMLGEGTAILEFEEAQAIARERAGIPLDGGLPLLVEGEFLVNGPPGRTPPTVEFSVRLIGGGRQPDGTAVRSTKLPLPQAPNWIAGELAASILPRGGFDEPLDADTACVLLERRADEFSRLGAYDHSIGIREAALLLQPASVGLRLGLIQNCLARVQTVQPLELDEMYPGSPAIKEKFGPKVDALLRAQEHAEYLIRNRRIDREAALRLASRLAPRGALAMGVSRQVLRLGENGYYCLGQEELARAQKPTRRFLLDVMPLILNLPPAQDGADAKTEPAAVDVPFNERWFRGYRDGVASRTDVPYLIPGDLNDLLRAYGRIPRDRPFVVLFGQPAVGPNEGPRAANLGDYEAFYRVLAESDLPWLSLSGRFMLLEHRFERLVAAPGAPERIEAINRLHEELAQLAAEYAAQPRPLDGTTTENDSSNHRALARLRGRIEGALASLRPDVTKLRRPAPREDTRPEPTTGAVRFTPVELRIRSRGDVLEDAALPSRPAAFAANSLALVSCGPKGDALWSASRVYWMDRPDQMIEIHHDSEGKIVAAAWDGRHLWLSRRENGLLCLALDGTRVAEIAKAHGLPPTTHGIFVHPLSPGRVLAMGSFENPPRAWAATVVVDDAGEPAVDIFFEAVHRRLPDATPTDEEDVRIGFSILAGHPHRPRAYQPLGETERSVLLVTRWPRQPLAVRLDTLSVSIFRHAGLSSGDKILYSRDGVLLVAGSGGGTALIAPPGQTWPNGRNRQGVPLRNPPAPNPHYQDLRNPTAILPYYSSGGLHVMEPGDGYLYYVRHAEQYWYRIDLETLRADLLTSQPMPPPWNACTGFAVSAHHGMITWLQGTMHRITVDSNALPKTGAPIFKN